MIDGIMLVWFVLVGLSVAFVAIDIRTTPAHPVMKWGFILLVAYTGVFGLVLYVLGCREPMRGTHERFVAARWRQVLGSTMHCVAGDGVGILAGAVIASVIALAGPVELALEYLLGFAFGWTIFQALFMRDMAGGNYLRSLKKTFFPELLSMNLLMSAMFPAMLILRARIAPGMGPSDPAFWFVMSMALLVGFIVAYPMNWWLVTNHLKHGMFTVRADDDPDAPGDTGAKTGNAHGGKAPDGGEGATSPAPPIWAMTGLSVLALGAGLLIARAFFGT
jgi:hypothetical protein